MVVSMNPKFQRKLRLLTGLSIATLVVGSIWFFMNGPQEERIRETEELVQITGTQIERFKSVCGFYPTSQQGLRALKARPEGEPVCADWNGPYTDSELVDAWDRKLFYSSDTKMFDLRSFGKDGKIGGTGNNNDIVFTPVRN